MSDDVDALFNRHQPTVKAWPDTLNDEERAWFDQLTARTRELGMLPVSKRAAEDFERRFGRSVSPTTLVKYLEREL